MSGIKAPYVKKPPQKFEKYGLIWPITSDPVSIEMHMIRNGGRWKMKNGQMAGMGLFYHFVQFESLLWPDKKWHKWNELTLQCFLDYRTIGCIGPASSGKSHSFASDSLADYYCFSDCTTVLCCSTTREMLEQRIWGEIKRLHGIAKACRSFIPGHIIESRQRIITDPKAGLGEGRDFRNGFLGVPCFPSGTLVDTPSGKVPIEKIKIGDVVINSTGVGSVIKTHVRNSDSLVRVSLSDGRSFDCTPEHPVLTQNGWVNARDLMTFDMVLSAHDTLRILREGPRRTVSQQKILPSLFQTCLAPKEVPSVQEGVLPAPLQTRKDFRSVLQSAMRGELGVAPTPSSLEVINTLRELRKDHEWSSCIKEILLSEMPVQTRTKTMRAVRQGVCFHPGQPDEAAFAFLFKGMSKKSHWGDMCTKARSSNAIGIDSLEIVPRKYLSLSHPNWTKAIKWLRSLVSNRHCLSGNKTGGGDRWWNPPHSVQEGKGCSPFSNPGIAWVESVEILEPSGDLRFNHSEGGYKVHNISVDTHPSYSVNGVIVHNCKKGNDYVGLGDFAGVKNKRVRLIADELHLLPRVFVDAISNLDKNPDFKAVGLGNPKETTDALGVMCEPSAVMGGWDSGIDQKPGTKTWETRRPQGICVQLPGSDSPNLDGKLGIPLITQEDIDRDVAFYGTDSIWVTMMDEGRMPRGQGSRRVLTRNMCLKNRAMEEAVWRTSKRTKVAFLDAAYKGVGGDRCIYGDLEFGEEIEPDDGTGSKLVEVLVNQRPSDDPKRLVLQLGELTVVPITADSKDEAEEQIAQFVKNRCEQSGISPQNFFYDSGMRTGLVSALSRLWSVFTNPIDCMGPASEKKVSAQIDMPCKEYYFNYITELWYSVRYVVEAGQFRGMSEDVLMEFSQREWTVVGKNKIQVEPKAKMKLKTGRSPDLADAVAVGIEGARRLGFVIQHIINHESAPRTDWIREARAKSRESRQRTELNYNA